MPYGLVQEQSENQHHIRVAEWLVTVTLVWEVCGSIPRNGSLTEYSPRVLKYLGRSLHDNSVVFLVPYCPKRLAKCISRQLHYVCSVVLLCSV